jgi:hypothetical protein
LTAAIEKNSFFYNICAALIKIGTIKMSNLEEITAIEFGQEMLTWQAYIETPLEVVSLYKHFDDYLPTIKKYQPDAMEETTLIVSGSYPSRQAALSAIGQWWDDAIQR